MFNVYSKDNQRVCEKYLTSFNKMFNVPLRKRRIKEHKKIKKGGAQQEKIRT